MRPGRPKRVNRDPESLLREPVRVRPDWPSIESYIPRAQFDALLKITNRSENMLRESFFLLLNGRHPPKKGLIFRWPNGGGFSGPMDYVELEFRDGVVQHWRHKIQQPEIIVDLESWSSAPELVV